MWRHELGVRYAGGAARNRATPVMRSGAARDIGAPSTRLSLAARVPAQRLCFIGQVKTTSSGMTPQRESPRDRTPSSCLHIHNILPPRYSASFHVTERNKANKALILIAFLLPLLSFLLVLRIPAPGGRSVRRFVTANFLMPERVGEDFPRLNPTPPYGTIPVRSVMAG